MSRSTKVDKVVDGGRRCSLDLKLRGSFRRDIGLRRERKQLFSLLLLDCAYWYIISVSYRMPRSEETAGTDGSGRARHPQRLALQPHVKTARACDDARMLLNSAKPHDSQDARQQLEYAPHGQQERSKIHAVMQPPVPGLFLERQFFANR